MERGRGEEGEGPAEAEETKEGRVGKGGAEAERERVTEPERDRENEPERERDSCLKVADSEAVTLLELRKKATSSVPEAAMKKVEATDRACWVCRSSEP